VILDAAGIGAFASPNQKQRLSSKRHPRGSSFVIFGVLVSTRVSPFW
jgi:hypothetical protein